MTLKDDLTIIIKTFERKDSLFRLLKSIEKTYKELKIIIVDDSKKSYKKEILKKYQNILNIEYYILDFDSGLSKGRNFLLNKVKTKYFLLCDDDFEIYEKTDLRNAYLKIEKYNLDILGGSYSNILAPTTIINILKILKKPKRILNYFFKKGESYLYNAKIEINGNDIYIDRKDTFYFKKEDVYITDMVQNFFIGKTESIKKISGWQPEEVKMGEHSIFFIRAKQSKLKIGFLENFYINHYPEVTLEYYKYRKRAKYFFELGCKELGIKVIDK